MVSLLAVGFNAAATETSVSPMALMLIGIPSLLRGGIREAVVDGVGDAVVAMAGPGVGC